MASFFYDVSSRLRATSTRLGDPNQSTSTSTPTFDETSRLQQTYQAVQPRPDLVLKLNPSLSSPSLLQSFNMAMPTTNASSSILDYPSPLPMWLNPTNAKQIVRGNFMPLSSRPEMVEQGEWIAHQVVEHYKLLWNFVRIIYEEEDDGSILCSCPKMSAGKNHSYTFNICLPGLEAGLSLSAHQYIKLVQQWISKQINDTEIFPTHRSAVSYALKPAVTASIALADPDDWIGKRSGFPKDFVSTCRIVFRQMFRVYAHLYWNHFVELFHLGLEKELNSSFCHFVLTATGLDMLRPHDLKPMQCLIDLLAANGSLPPDSEAYKNANVERGTQLLRINISPQAV